MQVVKKYPDGLFSWVDLTTPDPEGAKAFYTGLFGWGTEDKPTGMGVYTIFNIDGHTVAGMGEMPPDMQGQGIPPFWSSYVNHSDVDTIAAKAKAAGATLMMEPMDVMEEGRMVVFQDPTGASLGVWQPKAHIGAEIVNQPNALVWNELYTRDRESSISFYESVFGWEHAVDENGYVMYKADGRIQAGMMAMDESFGDMPPNWTVYFLVEDINASVAKVKGLGGNVLVPPSPAGEMGHFSVVQDPQGGSFTIMQFNGPVDPPPGH